MTELSTGELFDYDENGNMTYREENGSGYIQSYNAENRLFNVESWENETLLDWYFLYDGDGNLVQQMYFEAATGQDVTVKVSNYFIGGAYEVDESGVYDEEEGIIISATATRRYYAFGGQNMAMEDGDGLNYFLTDHLGSVITVMDESAEVLSQQRYYPFGGVREDIGTITETDYGFTGQRDLDAQGNGFDLGLMDYKARYFDVALGRFIQPDTMTPGGPQGLNRFAYSINNPINYTDPTGHMPCEGTDGNCQAGGGVGPFPPPEESSNPLIPVDPTIQGKGSMAIPQLQCQHLSGAVSGIYGTSCGNLNQATQIFYNPDATFWQKFGSGYYISVFAMSHAGLAIGLAGLACGLTQCYMAAVPLLTKLSTINPDGIMVSLGRNPAYTEMGQASSYTYFQLPNQVYNILDDIGLAKPVNQQFIMNQIGQGKDFIVSGVPRISSALGTEIEIIQQSGLYIQIISSWSSFTNYFVHTPFGP